MNEYKSNKKQPNYELYTDNGIAGFDVLQNRRRKVSVRGSLRMRREERTRVMVFPVRVCQRGEQPLVVMKRRTRERV